MLCSRGEGTVCISKVKGHAEEEQVRRMSLMHGVIFLGVRGRWYPVIGDLHRFFIAISRAVVNADDSLGIAPDPPVWSAGGLP